MTLRDVIHERGCIYSVGGTNVTPRLLALGDWEIHTIGDADVLRLPGCGRLTVRAFRRYLAPYLAHTLAPLSGHAGDCAKVTRATVTGETDGPCTCHTHRTDLERPRDGG